MPFPITHMAGTKIGEHELAMRVDQNIIGIDLLMNNFPMMQCLHCFTQLIGNIQPLGQTGLRMALCPLPQRLAFNMLHQIIEVASWPRWLHHLNHKGRVNPLHYPLLEQKVLKIGIA